MIVIIDGRRSSVIHWLKYYKDKVKSQHVLSLFRVCVLFVMCMCLPVCSALCVWPTFMCICMRVDHCLHVLLLMSINMMDDKPSSSAAHSLTRTV